MWYWVIMTPFGELVYFFCVKIHDFKGPSSTRKKKVKLPDLEYLAINSPSIHNKVRYGQGLHDNGYFEKAIEQFQEVLSKDEKHKEAIFGFSQCLIKLDKSQEAVEKLEQLVELDFNYSNYDACSELAKAYWKKDEKEKALELVEKMSSKSKQLGHQTLYGSFLIESGDSEKGTKIIERALYDYKNSPKFIKRRDKVHAKKAKQILASV